MCRSHRTKSVFAKSDRNYVNIYFEIWTSSKYTLYLPVLRVPFTLSMVYGTIVRVRVDESIEN